MSQSHIEKTGANPRHRETKVLVVSLPKTGTYSMYLALKTIGYQNVHHAINAIYQPEQWKNLGEACDRLFPSLPTYNGQDMTTTDWEHTLFGPYDAITDLAGPFAEPLIDAYPDAKVILVTRDFDDWVRSVDGLLDHIFGRVADLLRDYVEPLTGTCFTRSAQKMWLGWTGESSVRDIKRNLRQLHDRHHAMVRAKVPQGQLLEYRMSEGWEPLCRFLERPVPREQFPWGNDAAEFKNLLRERRLRTVKEAAKIGWMYLVAAVVMIWAAYVGWRH